MKNNNFHYFDIEIAPTIDFDLEIEEVGMQSVHMASNCASTGSSASSAASSTGGSSSLSSAGSLACYACIVSTGS